MCARLNSSGSDFPFRRGIDAAMRNDPRLQQAQVVGGERIKPIAEVGAELLRFAVLTQADGSVRFAPLTDAATAALRGPAMRRLLRRVAAVVKGYDEQGLGRPRPRTIALARDEAESALNLALAEVDLLARDRPGRWQRLGADQIRAAIAGSALATLEQPPALAMVLGDHMMLGPGTTRALSSASAGFRQGAWVTLGIVAGDTVFIVLAIFGLQWLAAALGDAFVWLKYLGAAYLLWLGFRLWRADTAVEAQAAGGVAASTSSFMSGLLLTLGDHKAILFYLGFFPAFIDLAALTLADALAVVVIAAIAVGGVKLAYAAAASRAGLVAGPRLGRMLNRVAGGVLLAAGVYLMFRA